MNKRVIKTGVIKNNVCNGAHCFFHLFSTELYLYPTLGYTDKKKRVISPVLFDPEEAAVMMLKELVAQWESHAQGVLTKDTYEVHLLVEDAAKIDALAEMYPKRTKDQLISELLSAALGQLEESFPYVQGSTVVATDEMGDAIYEDVGPTPLFMELTKKYLMQHKKQSTE